MAPRIYVACLAAYNAGRLHGRWVDANQSKEELQAAIQEMLKSSPEPHAEEYAVHDCEGFLPFTLGEWPDLDFVSAAAELLDGPDGEIIAAVHEHLVNKDTVEGLEASKEYFSENYAGTARCVEDWAEDFAHELGEVPEQWEPYIDWEKYARDLEIGGDIFTVAGVGDGVAIFWNR